MKVLGKHNPLLKELARLTDGKARREQGRFLVEGPRSVRELFASSLEVELVLASIPWDGPGETWEVEPAVLERLSPAETSQGVLAVARLPAAAPDTVLAGASLLVCDGVADPGNLGTLLRTARASGTAGALLIGGADPYAPKVVRAAAGALFHLPVWRCESWPELTGFEPVASVVEGGENLYTCELPARPAWLVGSEAHGLSAAALQRAGQRVTIPMRSGESLNVAISAALVMFEWLRRQEVSAPR